jgi:hypothetical protein
MERHIEIAGKVSSGTTVIPSIIWTTTYRFDNRTRDFWKSTPTAGFEISGSAAPAVGIQQRESESTTIKVETEIEEWIRVHHRILLLFLDLNVVQKNLKMLRRSRILASRTKITEAHLNLASLTSLPRYLSLEDDSSLMRLHRKLALTVVAAIDTLVLKQEYITGLDPDGSGVKVDEFRAFLVFYTSS